ncbi:MAG: class II aldolase/adducin family protein [Myxococcales bacterium]|nr:class II aldolase/adducin family protein [Polyangiaceae bacterium]MDW8249298.1 class II aldolase/adducin family protein [Myxococcales bacterium]
MEEQLRHKLITTARTMNACGLNRGTSGNLSVRLREGFLVTPTGMPYETLEPEDLVFLRLDGSYEGKRLPSSEWRLHRDILANRPEVEAVLHAHPVACTAVACLRREIPAFHYMIAVTGGVSLRCAAYATFGTEELSRHALVAIEGRRACLLANHGLLVAAGGLDEALKIAIELEALASMYLQALAVGEPVILSEEEMAEVLEKFATYGQQREAIRPTMSEGYP